MNNQNNNNQSYKTKSIPHQQVAQTNPLSIEHDYHNVDEMGKDLGVEIDKEQDVSLYEELKSRDKAR